MNNLEYSQAQQPEAIQPRAKSEYDYVVVGSGAGGGPLAANLAKAGYQVLLLEAGGDPLQTDDGRSMERYTYSVPAFHARSTEDEGSDTSGEDLQSVVEGVNFVRQITQESDLFTKAEILPGVEVDEDTELKQFIKNEAWGHHACGTCKIGRPDDEMAVLDSNFRVYGTQNLRVVDASVFSFIPGFFIVTPIYMISEKASDVILQDARKHPEK